MSTDEELGALTQKVADLEESLTALQTTVGAAGPAIAWVNSRITREEGTRSLLTTLRNSAITTVCVSPISIIVGYVVGHFHLF